MERIPRIDKVQTRPPYFLTVQFDNGEVRELDMKEELWGKMFEPLRDPGFFSQVRVHPELRTVVWPNGLDLAPETLYDPSLRALGQEETV